MSEEISYAKRPLESLFSNDIARILDFLLLSRGFEYTESELANITNLSNDTLNNILQELVNNNIVKQNRFDNITTFKINIESDLANILEKYITTKINLDLDKARQDSPVVKAVSNNN